MVGTSILGSLFIPIDQMSPVCLVLPGFRSGLVPVLQAGPVLLMRLRPVQDDLPQHLPCSAQENIP